MNKRRGFTVIEMLFAVSLLGVFSLLGFRLLRTNFQISRATLEADSNMARFVRGVSKLRADVSHSTSMAFQDPSMLIIRLAPGSEIDWSIDHNALVRRDTNTYERFEVGQPLRLSLDRSVALLTVNSTDEIAMASSPKMGAR